MYSVIESIPASHPYLFHEIGRVRVEIFPNTFILHIGLGPKGRIESTHLP